jgi:hypothetical protein
MTLPISLNSVHVTYTVLRGHTDVREQTGTGTQLNTGI